jgi:flavin prenyltransferase
MILVDARDRKTGIRGRKTNRPGRSRLYRADGGPSSGFRCFCSEIRTDGIPGDAAMRVIVGISGASGAIYGWRLLERLRQISTIEVHLILTRSGEKTLFLETGKSGPDVRKLADFSYPLEDIAAPIASGSFPSDAMVIAPCSIHSMSAIASGISSNLLIRAADVILKERRKLVLMVRESPFHLGHLRNMTALAEMGAIIAPPVPGFYHHPQTVMDIVDHSVDRVLDLIGIPDDSIRRWQGVRK